MSEHELSASTDQLGLLTMELDMDNTDANNPDAITIFTCGGPSEHLKWCPSSKQQVAAEPPPAVVDPSRLPCYAFDRPVGRFGFCWRGKLEHFIAHDFDALKIENGKITVEFYSQPGARPTEIHTSVYALDEIEHIRIELTSDSRKAAVAAPYFADIVA